MYAGAFPAVVTECGEVCLRHTQEDQRHRLAVLFAVKTSITPARFVVTLAGGAAKALVFPLVLYRVQRDSGFDTGIDAGGRADLVRVVYPLIGGQKVNFESIAVGAPPRHASDYPGIGAGYQFGQ